MKSCIPKYMAKTVVVDSDAIFALYNPNDALHEKASQTFQALIEQGFQLIYPIPVVFEIISLFQRVLPTPTITTELKKMILQDQLQVYSIDNDLLKEAMGIFNPAGSKKHTLIDCAVVAVAKKVQANGVFAYDEFYVKQGIKPAEEVIGAT